MMRKNGKKKDGMKTWRSGRGGSTRTGGEMRGKEWRSRVPAQGHEDGPVERVACRCWPMKSEEKRKDLARHRQCDTEAQQVEDGLGRARRRGRMRPCRQ